MADQLTVGEVATLYGVQEWQVRRVVDRLDADIPRAGRYRLISRALLGDVYIALRDRGFLPTPPVQPGEQQQSA